MKFKSLSLIVTEASPTYPNGFLANATLEVPGLGEVKVSNALSTELVERIAAEAEASLRKALGQVCSSGGDSHAGGSGGATVTSPGAAISGGAGGGGGKGEVISRIFSAGDKL